MAVGCFAGLMTGLLLSLLAWLWSKRVKHDKPLTGAELQSLRVRHIQSRSWH